MNNNCISAAEMISQEINLEKSIEEAGEQVPVSA